MRRIMLAILAVVLLGGAIIAGGALVHVQKGGLGNIYTDGQSIRAEADRAPLRSILWRDPVPFAPPIDLTGATEIEIAVAGDVILFVRSVPGERLNLFESVRTSEGWSAPAPLTAINSRDNELSPAVSPDGQVLVFASDRTGGVGGYDLWSAKRGADGQWSTPTHAGAVNSSANDYAATFVRSEGTLFFTSDRARTEDRTDRAEHADWAERARTQRATHDADILAAASLNPGIFGEAHRVDELCTDQNDVAPSFSPAGDFVYFASDRDGGTGGFDLYRARIDGMALRAPEALAGPINTPDDELDPMLWLDGFAVVYTSAPIGSPMVGLFEARSREVYLDRDVVLAQRRAASTWRTILPWLLGVLLLALLLALLAGLLRASRSERLARGWRRMSLFAKAVLLSLAVHVLLLLITAVWQVGTALGDYFERPRGTRVALLDRGIAGGAGEIARQVNAPMTEASTTAAEPAQQQRAEMAWRPTAGVEARQLEAGAVPATQPVAMHAEALLNDASPAGSDELPTPTPVELALQAREEAIATPDAPLARSQAEAPRAAPAPSNAESPQQAQLSKPSAAQVASETMQPQATNRRVASADAPVHAATARPAAQVAQPSLSGDPAPPATPSLNSPLQTPVAQQSRPVEQRTTQPLASAASAPQSRPEPPTPRSAAPQLTRHVLTPDPSAQPISSAHTNVALHSTPEATIAPVQAPPQQPMIARGEAALQHALARPVAASPTGTTEPGPSLEASLALHEAGSTSDQSRAPLGRISTGNSLTIGAAAIDPQADERVVRPTEAAVLHPSDATVTAANAASAEPIRSPDVPAMAQRTTVQAPSAAPPSSTTASEQQLRAASSAFDATPLTAVARPNLATATMDVGRAKALEGPGFNVSTQPSTLVAHSAHIDTSRDASGAAAAQPDVSMPSLATSLPVLHAVIAAPSGGAAAAREALAARLDNIVIDVASPGPTPRSMQEQAPTSIAAQVSLQSIEPVAMTSLSPRAVPATVVLPMSTDLPGLPAPGVGMSIPLAMTEVAPRTLNIPQVPRAPQIYPQREEQARKELVEQGGGSAETEAAVADALRWLATHQQPDGRWSGRAFDELCQCGGRSAYDFDKALTGLSLLCFLATDNTHNRPGPYQGHVDRALRWLVDQQREDGSLFYDESMYSHGIATIALCEAYGMSGDPALRDPVERAVAFIVNARNDVQGGWRYEPGQPGDTSVLGWQVMAMQSARKCGINVPEVALDNARGWLEKVALSGRPGLYAYQVGAPVSMSMTAEGMFVQQLLGAQRGDPRMDQSAQFILRELPDWERNANTYGWYYATLALYQHHGPAWQQWNERLSTQLVGAQRQDGSAAGSWDPSDRWSTIGGRVYQTAICCLTLQVYYRYLPSFVDQP